MSNKHIFKLYHRFSVWIIRLYFMTYIRSYCNQHKCQKPGVDKVMEQVPWNDNENWGNHHIGVIEIWIRALNFKPWSWRNHFIHPCYKPSLIMPLDISRGIGHCLLDKYKLYNIFFETLQRIINLTNIKIFSWFYQCILILWGILWRAFSSECHIGHSIVYLLNSTLKNKQKKNARNIHIFLQKYVNLG